MLAFFRCVRRAVVAKGFGGLAGELVPGGQWVIDVAGMAWADWRQERQQEQLRDDVEQLAAATLDEARVAAKEVAREVAAGDPKLGLDLELYLTQIPLTVRQSLARADDPTGTTVPANFLIQDEDDVARLLPSRLPRFRPGDAPTFLRGWVLEEMVGAGGFGEVWKGRNRRYSSLVSAFKFGHALTDRELVLLHEGEVLDRVMAAGRHPGIVALEGAWEDGDEVPWLRFEFVAGGDLTRLIHDWQRLPTAERLSRATAALRGLAETVGHFHRMNPAIVHRDLKPSNILVDAATGRLKIGDFGIGAVSARRLLDGETHGTANRAGRFTAVRGSYTLLYASPQQRAGSKLLDPRDDVHALGVIAYQMVTGRLDLGAGPDFADDLRDHGAPEGLVALLGRCVAQKSDRRPKDAAELAEALAALGVTTEEPPYAEAVEEAVVPMAKPATQHPAAATTPPAAATKRPNVAIPPLPPGLDRGNVPVQLRYISGIASTVNVSSWKVANGKFVRKGDALAVYTNASQTATLLAPVTGVISHNGQSGGPWLEDGACVATIRRCADVQADWTPGQVTQPPRPVIAVSRSGGGVSYPGDYIWAHLVLENTGRGDLVQVQAVVDSELQALSVWEDMIGRIKPGASVERCFVSILPPDSPAGEVRGELVFTEGNGFPIPARPLVFTVRPLPRPDFTTRWHVINDGSGQSHGSGDGRPKRGDYVDLAVTIHNHTGENFDWLFLTLAAKELPAGTRVTAPRGDLGAVADGATAEGRVGFAVDPGGKPGPATFELRVESADGRTFAVETVQMTIS